MDVLHLSIVSAAFVALAALVALRVRSAPTMADQGWLAAVAATGAAELLFNLITYDPASTDLQVLWATRAQVALICAHVAAWSAYSSAFMGLPLRRDAVVLPVLLACGLLALVPGAVLDGPVSVRPFSGLHTVYRDPRPVALAWLVFAITLVQAGRVALRFFRGWRGRVPWAGPHAAAAVIASALGANDALVISGLYPGPYLLDLCFAVPAGLLLVATGGRLVEIARKLAALRENLEEQVRARTAELVESQRQGRDARQLALLGQMTSGVAHELNNPISAAVSRLREVAEGVARRLPGDALAGELNEVSLSLLRVQGLASRLRNASLLVNAGGSPARVGLAATIQAAVEAAAPRLASADVAVDVEPGAAALAQEPVLVQILRSLLVNAVDSGGGRERVQIAVRARSDGPRVRIEVEDDGADLQSATLARGTDPSSGRRTASARSDLALAFARSLANGLGGELEIRSEPGRGTVASLELPAAEPDEVPTPDRS
jgi:signal transduction histidine kinase